MTTTPAAAPASMITVCRRTGRFTGSNIEAWSLHNAGADDQVTALLTRLSAVGEWSLLDEIGAATGLPVPQQDQAGRRGGEGHARGEQQANPQAGQERGPVREQRAEHGDR
jgi:hypothetical protein